MVELERIVENEADREAMAQLDAGRAEKDRESPDELPGDMLAHDAPRLKMLIARHVRHTGSERGRMILDKWKEYLPKFVKVMPVEYRKVLEGVGKQRL